MFPLIQLPRKSEAKKFQWPPIPKPMFPLIQLPRKSEVDLWPEEADKDLVSINSTSEEVRSVGENPTPRNPQVSINSTSEEVRSGLLMVHNRGALLVSINSTSEEVRSTFTASYKLQLVSINSTSEEVRSLHS